MMKMNLPFILVLFATMLLFSCTESKKSTTENGTTGTETVTDEAGKQNNPKKDKSPAARLSDQFLELGLELSAEQITQIDAIAAKYDFQGATDRDARKELRQSFQKEIFDSVLTVEQQNAYNQKKAER